jgi:hypothetical protein
MLGESDHPRDSANLYTFRNERARLAGVSSVPLSCVPFLLAFRSYSNNRPFWMVMTEQPPRAEVGQAAAE